ncbi:MAG: anthranilate synthase component II [Pirellulaceae bacterium]
MILLIDNYDSFAHNLARYLRELDQQVTVVRNDRTTIDEIKTLGPQAIVMSPGPCTPDDAGICLEVVRELSDKIPMLGVCLGHQAICQVFGGSIVQVPPVHGQSTLVQHNQQSLFGDIPSPIIAGRYHSLVADADTVAAPLDIIAWTDDGTLMGVAHQSLPVFGVQFHPESVLTLGGYQLLANFLKLAGIPVSSTLVESATSRLASQVTPQAIPANHSQRALSPHPW